MHILTTSTDTQSIKISARRDTSEPIFLLTDKTSRTTETISVTKTTDGDFMVLSASFSLKEGSQYSFRVKEGSTELYRGLIYCTDQTELDKFFINKDEYVSQTGYDNDFVIL